MSLFDGTTTSLFGGAAEAGGFAAITPSSAAEWAERGKAAETYLKTHPRTLRRGFFESIARASARMADGVFVPFSAMPPTTSGSPIAGSIEPVAVTA